MIEYYIYICMNNIKYIYISYTQLGAGVLIYHPVATTVKGNCRTDASAAPNSRLTPSSAVSAAGGGRRPARRGRR